MSTTSPKNAETARRVRPNKSSPRLFYVGMAVFMTAIVMVGFWPTYFGPILSGEAPGHPLGVVEDVGVLHLHGVVFFGWMVLLVTQTVLASRGQTRTHMNLGWYGMIFGFLVIAVGLLITLMEMWNHVSEGVDTWTGLVLETWPSIESLTQFIVLLTLGYVYRTRPEAHKRYILFATLALLFAATDRMYYLLGLWSAEIMFILTAGPILVYDLRSQRRIHPATLIGTAVLLPHFVLRATVGL